MSSAFSGYASSSNPSPVIGQDGGNVKLTRLILGDPTSRGFELVGVRPAGLERPKGLQHGSRIPPVALRGERERLVEGAAAMRAREGERRHQPRGLTVRIHTE